MLRSLYTLALVCALATPTAAQTATVSGTITDQSSAAVPGATVMLEGPGGSRTAISGSSGEYSFTNLANGSYKVTVTLSGFAPGTRDVVVSGANVEVPAISLALASLSDTIVVSASKSETALINAPATMSVVTSETLASSPAQNYGDLLRSVPGLNVIQMSARDINMTSRQGTSTLTNSQLVLLDGRSIYLDFFGLVLWDFVPSQPVATSSRSRWCAGRPRRSGAPTRSPASSTSSPRRRARRRARRSRSPAASSTATPARRRRQRRGELYGANAHLRPARRTTAGRIASRAGYFNSDPLPRPTGHDSRAFRIRATRPQPVGGAAYPSDATGALGTAFENQGTSQPKFDAARRPGADSGGRITYQGGYRRHRAASSTPASAPSTSRAARTWATAGSNYREGRAEGQRLRQPARRRGAEPAARRTRSPGSRCSSNFKTQTYDFEVGNAYRAGTRHMFSYGGNVRRNNFDITLAPAAEDRTELGAYVQDEIFFDKFRLDARRPRRQVRQHRRSGVLAAAGGDVQARRPTTRSASRSTARSARRRSSTTTSTSRS